MILKEHRNALLSIIQKSTIDISNFSSIQLEGFDFTIKFRDSPLTFSIVQAQDDYDRFLVNLVEYKPGFPTRELWYKGSSDLAIRAFGDADALYRAFTDWLNVAVYRYLLEKEAPDLWAEINDFTFFATRTSISEDDQGQFTESEKQQLREGLKEFNKLLVERFHPVEDQLNIINERLDYLSKGVDRLNRYDWKSVALTTLIGIATALSVDTETGKQILNMFIQAIGLIAGHIPPKL